MKRMTGMEEVGMEIAGETECYRDKASDATEGEDRVPIFKIFGLGSIQQHKLISFAKRDAGNKVSVLIGMMLDVYENWKRNAYWINSVETRLANLEQAFTQMREEEVKEREVPRTLGKQE